MRVLFGMILGAFFTVAGVYMYDSASTSRVASGPASVEDRTIVNWDVAAASWNRLSERTRETLARLSSRLGSV